MNDLLGWVLRLSFLGLLLAVLWYLAARLRLMLGWQRRWPLRLGVVALFIGAIACVLWTLRIESAWATPLNIAAGQVLVFLMYAALLLPIAHLAQLVAGGRGGRASSGSAMVAAGLVTLAGALHADEFQVVHTEVEVSGLTAPLRIAHLSDLHLGHHRDGDYLRRVVAATNRARPDLVLITGDLADADIAMVGDQFAAFADLQAPAYAVGGNHDVEVGYDRVLRAAERHGVEILRTEVVRDRGVQLVGLDYMRADDQERVPFRTPTRETIATALPRLGIEAGLPAILLHHVPTGFDHAAAAGIDLYLAGHTHAGQVWPGNLVARWSYGVGAGLTLGAPDVFVSPGLGTFFARSRIGSTQEISVLTLVPAT